MILKITGILLAAVLMGTLNNFVNPHRVAWVGNWPDSVNDQDTAWTSQSLEKGDAPTLRLSEAFDRFNSKKYVFLDAREPEEYAIGHIQGAINLPFEQFDKFFPQVEPNLPKDTLIVTYCSGSECDASLMLSRNLIRDKGYKNVEIFFGGWAIWKKNKLPIDGKYDDEPADK